MTRDVLYPTSGASIISLATNEDGKHTTVKGSLPYLIHNSGKILSIIIVILMVLIGVLLLTDVDTTYKKNITIHRPKKNTEENVDTAQYVRNDLSNGWTEWSPCTAACGGGKQVRSRPTSCDETSGRTCNVNNFEDRTCNENPCLHEKFHLIMCYTNEVVVISKLHVGRYHPIAIEITDEVRKNNLSSPIWDVIQDPKSNEYIVGAHVNGTFQSLGRPKDQWYQFSAYPKGSSNRLYIPAYRMKSVRCFQMFDSRDEPKCFKYNHPDSPEVKEFFYTGVHGNCEFFQFVKIV